MIVSTPKDQDFKGRVGSNGSLELWRSNPDELKPGTERDRL
jgi:hypothetical protein